MAEAEAGLELPIGLTEQKFLQQLARIESRAIKASKRAEVGFIKSNTAIGKSFDGMSRSARGNLQNVSFQLQDIFVQIAGGQGVTRALGQQLPQLLGGFGALGAGIGVAVSAMPLLISYFTDAEDEAGEFKDTVEALETALKDLGEAQKDLSTPVDDLIEKYRTLAGVMREAYAEQLRGAERALKTASTDVLEGITDQIDVGSQQSSADSYQQTIDAVTRALEQGIITQEEYNDRVAELGNSAAPTVSLLDELDQALASVASAESLEDYARAWADVRDFIASNRDILEENGVQVDALIDQANDLTIKFGDANAAASEIAGALDVATGAATNLQGAMVGVADSARAAASAFQVTLQTMGQISEATKLDPLGAFNGGQSAAFAVQTGAGGTIRTPELPPIPEAGRSGRRSGGGRGRSGGGGRSGREETPFFEDIEKNIAALQRELELVGKSNEEIATAKARWELLDEAKKRGMNTNGELNAQIDAQAASVGRLTAELEAAEIAQEQFDQAIDGIADAMAGALVAGESLREGLAQVFKQIASDILSSGIRNALSSQFSPTGGGGGGFFGNLFGGLFGGSSFDGGGYTGMGARSGGIDGKGGFPAILHPNETVVDHTRGQGVGSKSVSMTIDLRGTTGDRELDAKISRAGQQILAQVPTVMDNENKRRR